MGLELVSEFAKCFFHDSKIADFLVGFVVNLAFYTLGRFNFLNFKRILFFMNFLTCVYAVVSLDIVVRDIN